MNTKHILSILLLAGFLYGCSTAPPRELRAVTGITHADAVHVVRQGLLDEGYRVSEIRVEEGLIKAVSPELDRDLLWLIPWRKDRWTITVYVNPTEDNKGFVISANADAEERGVLESSKWSPRDELPGDEGYLLELLEKMDTLLISNGASFK